MVLEPSQFDSTLCEECYKSAIIENRFFCFPKLPSEDQFSDSFRKYHIRALEDEAVEIELQKVWLQALISFKQIRRVSLGHAAWQRGGRDAVRSDPLSFHRIPVAGDIPAVVSTQRNTGNRLLRLVVPLLSTPGFLVKRLSIETQGDCKSISRATDFHLNFLEHLNFGFGLLSSGLRSGETPNQSVQHKASTEMKHQIDLLTKLLKASRLTLTELLVVHARLSYSSLWAGPVFPPDMCCASLQILHLSAFNILGTHLISALNSNFPNLKHLIFSNYAEPALENSQLDGWPSFLRMLRSISPPRKLKIEGIITSLSIKSRMGDAMFSITLNKSYAKQYQAFTEQKCGRRAALSVMIRQYMDDLIEWDELVQSLRETLGTRDWFGDLDENDDNDVDWDEAD